MILQVVVISVAIGATSRQYALMKREQALPTVRDEPLVVTVTKEGDYYLNVGDKVDDPIDHQLLVTKVAAVLRHKPKTPIYVRGDTNVEYGKVVVAMSLLQKAGAPSVGLITEAPEPVRKKK